MKECVLAYTMRSNLTLSVLEWAQERLTNCEMLAMRKTGADRDGWLEDAAYWREIIALIAEKK